MEFEVVLISVLVFSIILGVPIVITTGIETALIDLLIGDKPLLRLSVCLGAANLANTVTWVLTLAFWPRYEPVGLEHPKIVFHFDAWLVSIVFFTLVNRLFFYLFKIAVGLKAWMISFAVAAILFIIGTAMISFFYMTFI